MSDNIHVCVRLRPTDSDDLAWRIEDTAIEDAEGKNSYAFGQ